MVNQVVNSAIAESLFALSTLQTRPGWAETPRRILPLTLPNNLSIGLTPDMRLTMGAEPNASRVSTVTADFSADLFTARGAGQRANGLAGKTQSSSITRASRSQPRASPLLAHCAAFIVSRRRLRTALASSVWPRRCRDSARKARSAGNDRAFQ